MDGRLPEAPRARRATTSVVATSPPRRPATSWTARGGSGTLRGPNWRPTRNAPVSYAHTPRTSRRIQPRSAPRPSRARRPGPAAPAWPSRTTKASSADVQRPEHRRHPGRQAIARVGPRERADADEDDPDRGEDRRPLPARASCRGRRVERRRTRASATPEPRQDRVAGRRAAGVKTSTRPRTARMPTTSAIAGAADDERRRAAAGRGSPRRRRGRAASGRPA